MRSLKSAGDRAPGQHIAVRFTRQLVSLVCAFLGAATWVQSQETMVPDATPQRLRTETHWRYELASRAIFGQPEFRHDGRFNGPYGEMNLSRLNSAKAYAGARVA